MAQLARIRDISSFMLCLRQWFKASKYLPRASVYFPFWKQLLPSSLRSSNTHWKKVGMGEGNEHGGGNRRGRGE